MIVNNEPTRFQANCEPSFLDHVLTNKPEHVDNVQTKPTIISDHKLVSFEFHVNEIIDPPKFIFKTEWWKFNKNNLTLGMTQSEKIMGILRMTSTEKVWNQMIEGINEVINSISTKKRVQCLRNNQPYITNDVREQIEEMNNQLEKAIETKDLNEWRLFRIIRNTVSRLIKKRKRLYYTNKMTAVIERSHE